MILHFSHIGRTDGRTFMGPFGRKSEGRAQAHAAQSATTNCSSVPVWNVCYASCQGVSTLGPSAVTAMVNSKCAASDPSCE